MSIFSLVSPCHQRLTRLTFVLLSSALALASLSTSAQAQANYPDKPIRLVVPYTPGWWC